MRYLQVPVVFYLLICFLCFLGCGKNIEFSPSLTIVSLSKNYGRANERIIISGTGFDTTPSGNHVFFNGKPAEVIAATLNDLTVKIPKGSETGVITVEVKKNKATGPVFNYVYEMTVSTLAGNGHQVSVDGIGNKASFRETYGIAIDSHGNLYAPDPLDHIVRKISPAGEVTTLAGSGSPGYADGIGKNAAFNMPTEVVVDQADNVYIEDRNNAVIRKITPDGRVTTLAGKPGNLNNDGKGSDAGFWMMGPMIIDKKNNIYVVDAFKIRMVTPEGVVTTKFTSPQVFPYSGLALDDKDVFYISLASGVDKFSDSNIGYVSFIGAENQLGYLDGPATQAKFRYVGQVLFDQHGNLIITDSDNSMIRELTPTGDVITLLGKQGIFNDIVDGPAEVATFYAPSRIVFDKNGNLYILDSTHRIRKVEFN